MKATDIVRRIDDFVSVLELHNLCVIDTCEIRFII